MTPGGLHGLVYNAGLSVAGPVELLDIDLAQREIDVNYIGAAAVTKALLPLLRASRGRIVYVTSVNGTAPVGLYASYSASKFALEGFAEALAIELDGTGVSVCVIEPGICNTDMLPQDIAVLAGMRERAPGYLIPQLDADHRGDPDAEAQRPGGSRARRGHGAAAVTAPLPDRCPAGAVRDHDGGASAAAAQRLSDAGQAQHAQAARGLIPAGRSWSPKAGTQELTVSVQVIGCPFKVAVQVVGRVDSRWECTELPCGCTTMLT